MSRPVLGCVMMLLWSVRAAHSSGFCPTILAPSPRFLPPSPYQTMLINGFWYGTAALWTQLPFEGRWDNLPFDGESYAQKVFWFSRDYDGYKELRPKIVVKSRRIDVDGPTFTLEQGTNAHLGDHRSAMLTGVILPTTGCWEISGEYRGKTLTFIISVKHSLSPP